MNKISYWCIWCGREIKKAHGLFIHDDVYHPTNFVFTDKEIEQ